MLDTQREEGDVYDAKKEEVSIETFKKSALRKRKVHIQEVRKRLHFMLVATSRKIGTRRSEKISLTLLLNRERGRAEEPKKDHRAGILA